MRWHKAKSGLIVPERPPAIIRSRGDALTRDGLLRTRGGSLALTNLIGFAVGESGAVTVEATNTSNQPTNNSTHTVSLPSGIKSGELLIILMTVSSGPAINTPADWTELYQSQTAGSVTIAAFYKSATGSEGASVSVTMDSARPGAHNSYRISGQQGSPEAALNASDQDPPNLTPSWPLSLNLWIAVAGLHSGDITGAPTNYANFLDASGGASQGHCGSARRFLQASSENPGAFSGTFTEFPRSATIAVRPAG